MRMSYLGRLSLILVMGSLSAITCVAAEPDATPRKWTVELSRYVWLMNISGRSRPIRWAPSIGANRSFSEIFDSMETGMAYGVEAAHGRLMLMGDMRYGAIEERYRLLPPISHARVKVDHLTLSMAAGWKAHTTSRTEFALFSGMRAWRLKTDINVFLARTHAFSIRDKFGVLDPIVGAQWRWKVFRNLDFTVRGDIGGFGVGSRKTGEARAKLAYGLTRHFFVFAEYRCFQVDHKEKHTYDVTVRGPVLGVTWRF